MIACGGGTVLLTLAERDELLRGMESGIENAVALKEAMTQLYGQLQDHSFSTVVRGSERSVRIAARLVEESVWFAVEPWPDGEFLFVVKPEAEHRLRRMLKEVGLDSRGEPMPDGFANTITELENEARRAYQDGVGDGGRTNSLLQAIVSLSKVLKKLRALEVQANGSSEATGALAEARARVKEWKAEVLQALG